MSRSRRRKIYGPKQRERKVEDGNGWISDVCPDGKRSFYTRTGANAAKKAWATKGDRQNVYKCAKCGYWHTGHLAEAVRQGRVSEAEYYGRGNEGDQRPVHGKHVPPDGEDGTGQGQQRTG